MALEVMKSIVEAERQAQDSTTKAQEQAQALLADAKAQSAAMLSGVKKNAKAEEEARVSAAVSGSRQQVEQISKNADQVCESIRQKAAGKKNEAVNAIIGKVVGQYVDR